MSLVWHQIKERPLVALDVGGFVLCLGNQGWSCGAVFLTPQRELVIHGEWKPFPTHTIEVFYVRIYAFLDKTETSRPRYQRKTRRVTLTDKGKFIVGKGPSGWHCGTIGENYGPVVKHKKDSVVGAVRADALEVYTLVDPGELPPPI